MRKSIFHLLAILLFLTAVPITTANGQDSGVQCFTDAEATVVVSAGTVGLDLQLAQEAAAEFMANCPNITVELYQSPDIAENRLAAYQQLFADRSPAVDVVQIDVTWTGLFAEHLIDLAPYLGSQGIAAYFRTNIANNTVNDALIAIPLFIDAGVLYYRSDLLAKYGYTAPPATWDELTAMAQVIMDGERASGNAGFYGFVWQGNAYEGLTGNALEWQFSETNTQIINPTTGAVEVYNDDIVATFERAVQWVGSISPMDVTRFTEEDARGIWQAGNAAFMRNRTYAYDLGNADGSPIASLFAVAPLPAGASTRAATLGGWELAVSKYARNPDAAAAVAVFMTNYDQQKKRAIVGGYSPAITALYEDAELISAAPFIAGLQDVFASTVARPAAISGLHYDEVSSLYFNAVHSILTGDEDATVALVLLELDIADVLAQ